MSRFSALDLSGLPAPSAIIDLDYGALLAARLDDLERHLGTRFTPVEVSEIMALARNIAASPTRYLNEASAARELYVANRINAAIRSVFLALASGADLDQIGANRGVVRRITDDSDPDALIYETDDVLRARIQLVIEAWSPHGTEGSYVYWALDADPRVIDVVPYGPDHDGFDPVIAPANVKVAVLSSEGDGIATQELLDAVYFNLIPDKRRPVGDKVEVVPITPLLYQIQATLRVSSAAVADLVLASSQASAEAFVSSRLRIGRTLYRTSVAAALNVDGVVDVVLQEPAADIVAGPLDAPHNTSIELTVETITGGWRDV